MHFDRKHQEVGRTVVSTVTAQREDPRVYPWIGHGTFQLGAVVCVESQF